jgi:hypothetical protein
MNFILMLYICGITSDICAPPMQHKTVFNDWYSCMVTGHADALDVYTNLEFSRVNDEQLAIGFECLEDKGDSI